MQASVPKELVPIAAGSLMSVVSATCAIFLALGQTIFQDRLTSHLSGKVPSELIDRILDSGATNIRSFVNLSDLPTVLEGYSKSITQVFVSLFLHTRVFSTNEWKYLPAAAPVIGFLIALGLKWTSLKQQDTAPILEENVDTESDPEIKA
jgi:hypothetical protein